MDMSLDDIQKAIRNALIAKYPDGNGDSAYWIQEIFLDHAIISDAKNQFYRVDYTLDEKGDANLSEQLMPVDITYTPIKEAVRLMEAKDPEGKEWDVVLIEAGLSRNRNFYPVEVLREASPLFEGARAMAHREGEHIEENKKSVRDIVGWYDNVQESGGRLLAKFHILESADWLKTMLLDAWRRRKKDLIGFSIDADGRTTLKRLSEGVVRYVEKIVRVASVDVVINPAAGGRLDRLVANNNPKDKEEVEMLEKLLKLLESKRPDLYKEIDPAKITEAEVLKLLESAVPEGKAGETKGESSQTDEGKTDKLTEAEKRVLMIECRVTLREALSRSNLPDIAEARIRKRFENEIFTEADLTEAIKEEREYLSKLSESGKPAGLGRDIKVTETERERLPKALDSFFAGKDIDNVPRFQSFREAHARITGRWGSSALDILTESYPSSRMERGRLKEALDSTSWAEILGDSIARRMIAEYNLPDISTWRLIVSSIVPVTDFRTQRRTRLGGYGTLPAVNQGVAYAALTSPTDEEITYSISKRGGLESLTIEMIANDDVGAVRRIPTSLGRAAAQTLYRFVFDFIRTNPTFDADSTAIFAAGHGNLGSIALSHSSLLAARVAMRKQTAYGNSSEVLGNPGRYLLIPPDLEDTAFQLANSEREIGTNQNQRNIFQGRIEPLVVSYWTDANDWALVADPANVSTIEIGFFEGREEPELFVQDIPNAGTMFDADKVTYKIRHIYSGDVLDYRGMYKAVAI